MERRPNEEQQRVIEALDHNIILFASAGTGKTFTVANRVSHIIRSNRARPEEILCLTFTIKACEEMREDILRFVGDPAKNVEIRTIHGFCYQLMREENRKQKDKYSEATVCDEVDAEELLKSILSSQYALWESGCNNAPADEEEREEKDFAIFEKKGALRNFVTALKHVREEQDFYTGDEEADYRDAFGFIRQRRTETYENILSVSSKRRGQVRDHEFEAAMNKYAGRLVVTYDDYLRQSNRVDFDDLILFASRYLKDGECGKCWANRYKYIIVDEMQDTSLLEYAVLKRIFGKNNVMMCGDFFQSIYEWRGSKPEYVLDDFIKEFSAKIYMFSENYRSTRLLTQATFGYLRSSYPELMEKYCPDGIRVKSGEEGEKILLLGFDGRKEEAHQIYKYIRKVAPKKPMELCVMARSNGYIASLSRAFEEFNQEYPEGERLYFYTAEEDGQFYKKPVIKDILAVLRILFNKTDRVSMERITEKYVRLVGAKTIERIREYNAVGASIVSFLDPQTYEHADPYHVLIEGCQKGNIVVYDTETTGLDLAKDEIVQLSAIRMDKEGNIVGVFDRMIEPTVPIGQGAYETHGFDIDYIRAHGGRPAKEVLQAFSEFVKGGVLVGHNSFRFDSPLIKRELKENGLPPLEIACEYDTLVIAKQFHAKLPDFRLSTLCFKYGIVNEAAHNAYGDIVATGQVLFRMIREDVLPSAMERQTVLLKHREKFEKLYGFFSELREKLEICDGGEIVGFIIEKMRMNTRYTGESDQRAMNRLTQGLRTGKTDAEETLQAFLQRADLAGSRADLLFAGEKQIPILTVHQSKGCEFDTVILAGADEGNFPSFFARESGNEEEEKRVFYVAISRAKKKLILTRAAYNGVKQLRPSPYAEKIPKEFVWANRGWDKLDY